MPVATTSRLVSGPVPSFVSLYTASTHPRLLGNSKIEFKIGSDSTTDQPGLEEAQSPLVASQPPPKFAQRDNESESSDSTGSSPTAAALSTAETPGTSPDTPAFFQSVSYPSLSTAIKPGWDQMTDPRISNVPAARKARNLKNLALNTSNTAHLGRTTSSPALHMSSPLEAPPTPSDGTSSAFMKPVNPPRRRGSALSLSIKTPTTQSFSIPQPIAHPPTLGKLQRPAALRQFQSSPSVPLMTSGQAPEGGMRLPTFTSQFTHSLPEHDEVDNYDVPPSKEEMPEAYPDGPICIYEPHVYLYLEPSAEQASEYDVVFNVASEVPNPFTSKTTAHVTSTTLETAAEAPRDSRPQPKILGTDQAQPEYIHIPWEHNTDIVPDLHELVKVVDDRVESGKRVLIHCQCGVSRSASLIVAYGIYKNPAVSVQQAYDAVKKRSKWIGPNMNLIMQLQEFRSGLIKSSLNTNAARFQRQGGRILHSRPTHEGKSSFEFGGSSNFSNPQTAPLSRVGPTPIKTHNLGQVEPGPSSAPACNFGWPGHQSPSPMQLNTALPTSYVDAAGQVLDPNTVPMNDISTQQNAIALGLRNTALAPNILAPRIMDVEPSPRATEFAMTSLSASNVDPSFGITSPRSTTFNILPQSNTRIQQTLSTPRSTTFAMTSLHPTEASDTATLGLTSPRNSTFATQLPQRVSPAAVARLGALRPSETPLPLPPSTFAHRHPNRPIAITSINPVTSYDPVDGMTTSPTSATLLSPRATEFTRSPFHEASMTRAFLPSFAGGAAETLMSPRATEFTRNALHDCLSETGHLVAPAQRVRASTVSSISPSAASASVDDPRSPPVRGGNPIMRDILDVL